MAQEGQIVRNKATGAMGVIRNGQVVPVDQQQAAPVNPVIAPPDPYKQAAEQRAQANDARDATRTGIAVRGEERSVSNTNFDQVSRLRDDYNADPTVKAYRTAIQQLGTALNTGEGAQADLALTYAFAKAMDPDSVVREAEQGMVSESQPWFQARVEQIKKQFGADTAGNFTPEARRKLRQQIINAVSQRNKGYLSRREYYGDFASRHGFDPNDVLGEHDGTPFMPALEAFDKQGKARDPETRGGLPVGTQIQWDVDAPEDPFDRGEYLQERFGITGNQEAIITAFWNANSGNAKLTEQQVRDWYGSKGFAVPAQENLDEALKNARAGKQFGGIDTSRAEQEYTRQLDQVIAQRRPDAPEDVSGAAGVNAAQGVLLGGLDELHGLVGGATALARGDNPAAAYQAERDIIRREEQRAEQAHPYVSAGAELAGSLPTGGAGFGTATRLGRAAVRANALGNTDRAANLGRQAARASVLPGAASGAVYGFNTGEGAVGSGTNALLGAATGATIAPIAAMGGNALARKVGTPSRTAGREVTEDAAALSDETGIRIMTSDAVPPDTFTGKVARSIGERIPYAGTGGPRAAQQEERKTAVREVLEEFGGIGEAAAIDDVMRDLSAQRSAALTRWTNVKQGIKQQLGGDPVPVTDAQRAITQQIVRLRSLNSDEFAPVIAKLENWRTALEGQSIENIELLRRQIGDAFKAPELASVRSTGEDALSAIYGPLRDDITRYVRGVLGEDAGRRWTAANRNLSEMAGELKVGRLKSVLRTGGATPEDVGKLLFSARPSEIRQVYRGLSEDGRANARAAIMQHVFQKLGSDVENISPDRFLNVIKTVSRPIGVFFEGADALRVQGLIRALKITRQAAVASAAPPTGVQNAPVLGALGLGALFEPATAIGTGVSIGLLARAYESAPVRNALLKLARTKPGSPQERTVYQHLQGAIARLPAANDNAGLVGQALSQSPGRLAAAEQEQD